MSGESAEASCIPLALTQAPPPFLQHPRHKEAFCLTCRDEKVDHIVNGTTEQPIIHSDSSIISPPRQMTDYLSSLLCAPSHAEWLFCQWPWWSTVSGETLEQSRDERVQGPDGQPLYSSSPFPSFVPSLPLFPYLYMETEITVPTSRGCCESFVEVGDEQCLEKC